MTMNKVKNANLPGSNLLIFICSHSVVNLDETKSLRFLLKACLNTHI
jgi:hypothetical protein